jgi:hypothetical protein
MSTLFVHRVTQSRRRPSFANLTGTMALRRSGHSHLRSSLQVRISSFLVTNPPYGISMNCTIEPKAAEGNDRTFVRSSNDHWELLSISRSFVNELRS